MSVHIDVRDLKKVFNRRVVFEHITFSVRDRQTLLVSGRNGSGKSTLLKILAGVLTPTAGSVKLAAPLEPGSSRASAVGLVSPYLMMYDEFSPRENVALAVAMRGMKPQTEMIDALLEKVSLFPRRNDLVRTFSSGMKQRVKYAFALVHAPAVLLLDEPMANLDSDGSLMVRRIMDEQRERGILVVATNDLSDLDRHDVQVDLNDSR